MYTEEQILRGLSAKGYALSGYEDPIDLPTDDLIMALFSFVHRARMLEGLAIVIGNSPPDYIALVKRAKEEGLQNQVGYLLEGALRVLAKHRPADYSGLDRAITELYESRLPSEQKLTRSVLPNEDAILRYHIYPEDIRWNIIGGIDYNQMEVQFCVYEHQRQAS